MRIDSMWRKNGTLLTLAWLGLGAVACGAQPDGNPDEPKNEPSGEETLPDGSTKKTSSDGYVTITSPDGTVTVTAPDGTVRVTSPDGTLSITSPDGTTTISSPDGTKTVVSSDGTRTTTSPDGTVTIVHPDGTTEVKKPGDMVPDEPSPGEIWINPSGRVDGASNSFGIQGDWYSFGDGVTTTQSGSPYEDGKYCIVGVATGDSANWGAGLGLDLNATGGIKMPYLHAGKLSGFRMKITGQSPTALRLNFVTDQEVDVNPFIEVTPSADARIYNLIDAQVPYTWQVDNAGQKVGDALYAVQLLAPGDSEAGPIDICIEEFEPVFDPNVAGGDSGTTYINSDGFVTADGNDYGITGPIYVISDGNSTSQSGVPYDGGKYCVSGEFSGNADDWGAGIAFDLNNPPGQDRATYDPTGKLHAFRLGLSGSTPGSVRVQFIVNEPQEGNQPFLVGQLNSTAVYPLPWAQVPTSWEVADAGLEVGTSVVSMQVYLAGDVAGPFELCIDDMAPLTATEVSFAAQPAAGGNGFQTVDPARISGEYQLWKSRHFVDCGDGTACVPRDDGDCISEGIGYGMLLSVGNDDRDAFDKLWGYFKKNRRASGLMNWQTAACGAVIGDGAATDGDLDAAMALIQAACRFDDEGLRTEAVELINAISENAVVDCNGKAVLRPGDDFGGCTETNPSYVAPAYYRVFETLTGNSVWSDLIDAGYELLAANQTRKGGVFSDWSNDVGQAASTGNQSDDFGPDASRVPWRLATDYLWNGEPRAVPLLDAFRAAVEAEGGPHRAFTPNSNYRGGSAFAAQVADAATAGEATEAWLLTAADDQSYFPGTLRPIYMMLAAGTFAPACQ